MYVPATTVIYTLSLHDALPISRPRIPVALRLHGRRIHPPAPGRVRLPPAHRPRRPALRDRVRRRVRRPEPLDQHVPAAGGHDPGGLSEPLSVPIRHTRAALIGFNDEATSLQDQAA